MEKLKILQVNKLYYPEIGGIEKTLQQISEGLNGFTDLKVLVCQKKGKGRTEIINGVEIHRTGSFGVLASVPISISFIWNLRKLARDRDVIQFHMPFPLGDLACLLSGYQGKVVAYWHSDVVKQKNWMRFYKPIMERFLKRADMILVGAEGIIEGSQYLKPYRHKCRVVPFAVSEAVLRDGKNFLEQSSSIKKRSVTNFLFIGRLVYYKGCSVLLEAFSMISSETKLTIIGDGTLKEELLGQADAYEVSARVDFKGHISEAEMKKCMRAADVFVLPSVERSEAFGLVQLEAMAYGIPVINTSLPSGVPEVSIHKETGLTVEPGNARELANAMEWMHSHPAKSQIMGVAARKRVEERFTEQILVNNLKIVYEELCTK